MALLRAVKIGGLGGWRDIVGSSRSQWRGDKAQSEHIGTQRSRLDYRVCERVSIGKEEEIFDVYVQPTKVCIIYLLS